MRATLSSKIQPANNNTDFGCNFHCKHEGAVPSHIELKPHDFDLANIEKMLLSFYDKLFTHYKDNETVLS